MPVPPPARAPLRAVTAPPVPVAPPACIRLNGHVGLLTCDYCGIDVHPVDDDLVVRTAARRVRRGDVLGALRLIQKAAARVGGA